MSSDANGDPHIQRKLRLVGGKHARDLHWQGTAPRVVVVGVQGDEIERSQTVVYRMSESQPDPQRRIEYEVASVLWLDLPSPSNLGDPK